MRIRRKKNLKERLENVKDFLIVADKKLINVNQAVNDKKYIDKVAVFGNSNVIELEIGCGKGGFITALASANPDKNYLAVELIDNVIVSAAEKAKADGLKNVKFLNTGAEYLARYISSHSIENIYLNFSPPFPQKTHENRRLTNTKRITDYKEFLKPDGNIYLKTDDKDFFEYSKEMLKNGGFEVKIYDDDSGCDEKAEFLTVFTEYEKKFIDLGIKINRLSARLK